MGCLWVGMALHPPAGLHGALVAGTWLCLARGTITPPLRHLSCPGAPGRHTDPIPASLRDYSVFTANRCRKTGPETAQQQLAANESLQIIYWTLVSQSDRNCCFSSATEAKSHKTPFISGFNQWLPTSAGQGGL